MQSIPFPNPHEADALNDYLDTRASGVETEPEDSVQAAASDFHRLAASARFEKGPRDMSTATLTSPPAPVSNRTRRHEQVHRTPSRWNTWISTTLVAALLLSVVGYGIWSGPGRDDNNLAWAPQTASPMAEEPLLWTAPISPRECPEDEVIPGYDPDNPSGVLYTQEDYDKVSSERDYEIIGRANPKDANAVVSRMRQVQGCAVYAKQLPWWSARFEYENRTTAGRTSLEAIGDQRASAEATVGAWYEDELGLTPADMWVEQNPADLTLDGSGALVTQGLFNPDHAVQFADGRIGIIHSVVTYEPVEHVVAPYYSPNMSIFVLQDGQWMLDETLPICFGECEAMTTPVTTAGESSHPFSTPVATPEG